ncbi:MAG: DUF429 domain-containing protein [Acidimicrobiia bacterium]|nr:DUF429 domain-containing protein [Acidimicrobiia bacterium]
MKVVGVDGWPKGWVTVTLDDGRFVAADVFANLAQILALEDVSVFGVDIPIGLPAAGHRQADIAAKRILGSRASSVFFAPPRAVLRAGSYQEANELSKEKFGAGISAQSYALRNKILEADALAAAGDRLFEVHPEVTFWSLAGEPLPSKKTWDGMWRRRRLLADEGLLLPEDLGPAGVVPVDDLLDAAAASISAFRIATGRGTSLPDTPEPDGAGRPMAIWY